LQKLITADGNTNIYQLPIHISKIGNQAFRVEHKILFTGEVLKMLTIRQGLWRKTVFLEDQGDL